MRSGLNLIDVEASGLEGDSYPIEIAILLDDQLHRWLITPEPSWTHWEDEAEGVHGISREMLAREGQNARVVAEEFNRAMEHTSGLLYSDAVRWDARWVRVLFATVGLEPRFQMESIYGLLTPAQLVAFEQQRTVLGRSGRYRLHRADADVRLLRDAFCAVTVQT